MTELKTSIDAINKRVIDLENKTAETKSPNIRLLPDNSPTSEIITKINELILIINKNLR
ncbi:MAG: hypothetical protein JHC33_09095 [Ignisphaera sp.]|nr:hypothetical protein [Ignisphaera sp.]